MSLQELAQAFKATSERANREPLKHMRWLPGQFAFLNDPSPRKLFRAGNQSMGKTTAGLADIIFRCMGSHPFLDVPDAPIEAWVICASWSQSLAIQGKLWALLPKDEVHPDTEFCPVKGFRGVNPACRFKNNSIIRIKTTNQGISLAGSTIHVALFDEPPKSPRVYGEVQKRVLHAGKHGCVMLALTPVNADCGWLQEAVESGLITDHHYRLEPKNLIPIGQKKPMVLPDGTVCDQKWIDKIVAESLPWEVPVVVHGAWNMSTVGAALCDFRDTDHITSEGPVGEVKLALGMDHGDGSQFSQFAVLVAVQYSQSPDGATYPRVWILDEYCSESTTTPDMDARSIRIMLNRHGIKWEDLDHVWGDRNYPGRRGGSSKKSNLDLIHAMARELHVPHNRLRPHIRTVKRGKGRLTGSVHRGIRFIHYCMVRPGHFHISPNCKRLIECIKRYEMKSDEWAHGIDALRYALNTWIFEKRRSSTRTNLRIGV